MKKVEFQPHGPTGAPPALRKVAAAALTRFQLSLSMFVGNGAFLATVSLCGVCRRAPAAGPRVGRAWWSVRSFVAARFRFFQQGNFPNVTVSTHVVINLMAGRRAAEATAVAEDVDEVDDDEEPVVEVDEVDDVEGDVVRAEVEAEPDNDAVPELAGNEPLTEEELALKNKLESTLSELNSVASEMEALNPSTSWRQRAYARARKFLPKTVKEKIHELSMILMDRGWKEEDISMRLGLPMAAQLEPSSGTQPAPQPVPQPAPSSGTQPAPAQPLPQTAPAGPLAAATSALERFERRHPPATVKEPRYQRWDDLWKHIGYEGGYSTAGSRKLLKELWDTIIVVVLNEPNKPWSRAASYPMMVGNFEGICAYAIKHGTFRDETLLMTKWLDSTAP